MKQLELIELVQQHHPDMGYTEIRSALNRAQNDYSARTELLKKTYTQTSVAGQRYYELSSDILKITRVQINDVEIPRLIGSPIIDDDEFDNTDGLTAGSTSSNERYWYIDSGRLGVVEKVTNAITRDDKTSDYQSISVAKEMRIYAIGQGTDFGTTLTQESDLPTQFHEALSHKVISDGYLIPPAVNVDAHKMFYTKYMDMVKEGRKYARSNYNQTGFIRQTHF
tara:strand:- start:195 stop:866 length:672 start_codon:yes stop_codon:yes gene_type:complete